MNLLNQAVIIAYGRPRSGKSSAIKYNVLRRLQGPTPPETVYVFCSPGTKNDGTYDYVPSNYIICNNFEAAMKEIADGIESEPDITKRRPILIILDDVTGLLKWQDPIWTHVITNTAHHNSTYILGVHLAQKTAVIFREASTEAWMFHQQTFRALKSLYEAYGSLKWSEADGFNQFKAFMKKAVPDPDCHCFVRYRPAPDKNPTSGMNEAQIVECTQFQPMKIPWPIPEFRIEVPPPPKKKKKGSKNNKGKDNDDNAEEGEEEEEENKEEEEVEPPKKVTRKRKAKY